MQGLALSQSFYEEHALPLFAKNLPELLNHAAFGLAGEGSECFGFDDSISHDHDFGPTLCIWIPEEHISAWRGPVEKLIKRLPSIYAGLPTRTDYNKTMGRAGLMSIEDFYDRFIGHTSPPQTWQEWRTIPEHFLATATNGTVYSDSSGQFTAFRQALLDYYPEDVRLKKMAARCAIMAQAGQYNALRSLQRGEQGAAMLAIARFSEAAISLAFLLNKRYVPFYKWAHRAVRDLPILGAQTHASLSTLSQISMGQAVASREQSHRLASCIEEICVAFTRVFHEQGLSDSHDSWMLHHASAIQSRITTLELRSLSAMLE